MSVIKRPAGGGTGATTSTTPGERYTDTKLKGARDVPPEKYLSLETILPADELPANVEEILEEHFYEWRRMANGAYYMKLWEDYSGVEDAYWAACKALGLQCYWPWYEEQSHDY